MEEANDNSPDGTPSTSELASCLRGTTTARFTPSGKDDPSMSAIPSNSAQDRSESLSLLTRDGEDRTILLVLFIIGVRTTSLLVGVDIVATRTATCPFQTPPSHVTARCHALSHITR